MPWLQISPTPIALERAESIEALATRTTSSRPPQQQSLPEGRGVRPGTHITCMGSDGGGGSSKRTVRQADLCVVDSRSQCLLGTRPMPLPQAHRRSRPGRARHPAQRPAPGRTAARRSPSPISRASRYRTRIAAVAELQPRGPSRDEPRLAATVTGTRSPQTRGKNQTRTREEYVVHGHPAAILWRRNQRA